MSVRILTYLITVVLAWTLMPPILAQNNEELASEKKFIEAALAHRYRLDFDGKQFSGPGWRRLVDEGKAADYFLIGETHGIKENPILAASLFEKLKDSGYSNLAVEISSPIAAVIDSSLQRDGLDGLRELYSKEGGEPAHYGLREEAELLYRARRTNQGADQVILGFDYAVPTIPYLLSMLSEGEMPPAAREGFSLLEATVTSAKRSFYATADFMKLYSISGDPALARDVRLAWPERTVRADKIIRVVEETAAINRRWAQGKLYLANFERARFMRKQFIQQWIESSKAERGNKLMAKFGANHMVRGLSPNGTFGLGSLIHELAALMEHKVFSIYVRPGNESEVSMFMPNKWRYETLNAFKQPGLDALEDLAFEDTFTLIDLRPLRALTTGSTPLRLKELIHGSDMILLMNGSRAATEFDHTEPPLVSEFYSRQQN